MLGWIADDACGQHEVMDAEAYKVVVTGESISVERKGTSSVECRFDIPVLLTMNSLPGIKDSSDAVYNRTLVLPMTVVCAEQDAKPIAEMVIGVELSGVLNWAVAGWHRLRERGRFDAAADCMTRRQPRFQSPEQPFSRVLSSSASSSIQHRMMLPRRSPRCVQRYLRIDVQARNGWSGKAIANAIKQLDARRQRRRGEQRPGLVRRAFTEAGLPYLDLEFGKTKRSLQELNMLPPDEIHRPPPPAGKSGLF